MSDDLYNRDFYLWTQDQASALRARSAGENALDYDLLAEEVEDLGSTERNKVRSAARLILEHLYKLHATRNAQPVGHWQAEILNFRSDLEDAVTPTIRRHVEDDLEALHRKAAKAARLRFQADEPVSTIDVDLRWTWDQITGDRDDPLDDSFPIARD